MPSWHRSSEHNFVVMHGTGRAVRPRAHTYEIREQAAPERQDFTTWLMTNPDSRGSRRGKAFAYRDAKGRVSPRRANARRIRSLVIPPAWTDVWICARADGHLQATGRDARGRKQHRYHPSGRPRATKRKYDQMIEFALALPAIRGACSADLRKAALSRRTCSRPS